MPLRFDSQRPHILSTVDHPWTSHQEHLKEREKDEEAPKDMLQEEACQNKASRLLCFTHLVNFVMDGFSDDGFHISRDDEVD